MIRNVTRNKFTLIALEVHSKIDRNFHSKVCIQRRYKQRDKYQTAQIKHTKPTG